MLSTWLMRGRDQARQVATFGTNVGQDLGQRVHIAAARAAEVTQKCFQYQDMQHAHTEITPVGTVVGGKAVHGGVGAQPRQEPLAVGHGAKAE